MNGRWGNFRFVSGKTTEGIGISWEGGRAKVGFVRRGEKVECRLRPKVNRARSRRSPEEVWSRC